MIERLSRSLPYWLPAALLTLVALNQLRLAHTDALSPWAGGGFGMFSSTDSPANRHLHAVLQNEGVRQEVAIPGELEESVLRATTLPRRDRLAALAAELALIESSGHFAWDDVVIQVWSKAYDSHNLAPSGKLLRHERFAVAPR